MMKGNMKSDLNATRKPKAFSCWRCVVFFYLILFCVSGIVIGLSASFFLIFRHESHGLSPKILLYFLLVPTASVIGSTILGWTSVRKKNVTLIKLFALLLGLTAILEISGSLWCFASVQKIQNDILGQMSEKFSKISMDKDSESYWNQLQKKYECCGYNGPTDYKVKNSFPFSCCGSKSDDDSQGSCTLVWQKGCSEVMVKNIVQELILIGLIVILIAFIQIPGVFFSWCFANRISRESI